MVAGMHHSPTPSVPKSAGLCSRVIHTHQSRVKVASLFVSPRSQLADFFTNHITLLMHHINFIQCKEQGSSAIIGPYVRDCSTLDGKWTWPSVAIMAGCACFRNLDRVTISGGINTPAKAMVSFPDSTLQNLKARHVRV